MESECVLSYSLPSKPLVANTKITRDQYDLVTANIQLKDVKQRVLFEALDTYRKIFEGKLQDAVASGNVAKVAPGLYVGDCETVSELAKWLLEFIDGGNVFTQFKRYAIRVVDEKIDFFKQLRAELQMLNKPDTRERIQWINGMISELEDLKQKINESFNLRDLMQNVLYATTAHVFKLSVPCNETIWTLLNGSISYLTKASVLLETVRLMSGGKLTGDPCSSLPEEEQRKCNRLVGQYLASLEDALVNIALACASCESCFKDVGELCRKRIIQYLKNKKAPLLDKLSAEQVETYLFEKGYSKRVVELIKQFLEEYER